MLRTFFICLLGVIFVFFSYDEIVDFLLVRKFVNSAEAIIKIYEILEKDLEANIEIPEDEVVEITYKKYKLEYSDVNEASIVFEEFIDITLDYYEYIVDLGIEDEKVQKQKNEITQICYELRKLRWLKR